MNLSIVVNKEIRTPLNPNKMKKVLVLAISLTVLSCSNKEDCTAERTEIINKYEKLVEDVRNKEYWSEETVVRLYKDMNSALDRLKCD